VNVVPFDRTWRRWRYALEGVALVVSLGVMLYGVCSYHLTVDWTHNERHSLHNASKLALTAVTLPLTATVYLPDRHPHRELAKNLVLRYQRAAPALSLHFVDPAAVPELMRNEEIREGEITLSAGDRRERVRQNTEAAFTNALMRLARKDTQWLAFITGHGDVPMAVETMKKGAVDFVQKPFREEELVRLVEQMLAMARDNFAEYQTTLNRESLLAKLTTREAQVLERIVAGRLNKQIADDLGISIKTVEAHRANIMEKLNANTVADLLKIALGQHAKN
jgi:FixJ family two-component response regulator